MTIQAKHNNHIWLTNAICRDNGITSADRDGIFIKGIEGILFNPNRLKVMISCVKGLVIILASNPHQ